MGEKRGERGPREGEKPSNGMAKRAELHGKEKLKHESKAQELKGLRVEEENE